MKHILIEIFTSAQHNVLLIGLMAGIIIVLGNTVGALLIFVFKKVTPKMLDFGLGFAAGLMLAASFTSLIIPGIHSSGIFPILLGIIIGAIFLDFITHSVPHIHIFPKKINTTALWLFIMTITIHNMPEGFSVGVSMGSKNIHEAISFVLAIAIQNIPEGFSVAFSHYGKNPTNKFTSALIGIMSGLIEIPLVIIGIYLVSTATFILPYAIGFCAGAMLYVINNEIIPDTHSKGFERIATFGTILGVATMLALDLGLS